jgi:hypothetical protein
VIELLSFTIFMSYIRREQKQLRSIFKAQDEVANLSRMTSILKHLPDGIMLANH